MTEKHESIALVDLSYLFKLCWHGQARDAAPGAAAQATLNRLAGVRESVSHVIVCLDSPPYRRKDIDPQYKAQREKPTDDEVSQKRWLLDRIDKDGYQIARAKGYEADDIIATLCIRYDALCDDIRIISADKDCAQMVKSHIRMFVPAVNGRPEEIRGPEEIRSKYGVAPEDMGLFIALMGDDSDNIAGVPGVGKVKAAKLIQDCKSIVGIAEALAVRPEDGAKPDKLWASIATHWEQLVKAEKLTRLDLEVPLDSEALLVRKESVSLVENEMGDAEETAEATEAMSSEYDKTITPSEGFRDQPELNTKRNVDIQIAAQAAPSTTTTAIARTSAVTEDLQPLDLNSAYRLSNAFYDGRMYSKFPNAMAIFTILVKARELGLKVTTALDGFHVIEGKPSASADMIRGLAERHPDCEYFMLIESSADGATWETKHRRHPKPTRYTYTISEAKQAGLSSGNWQKRPRDMVTKTAGSKLARLVYPGAVGGLYSPEEFE